MWTNYRHGVQVSGTNIKTIMVQWAAGQVQGDVDSLGKHFCWGNCIESLEWLEVMFRSNSIGTQSKWSSMIMWASGSEYMHPGGGYMWSNCRSCPSIGSGIVQGVHMTSVGWFMGCGICRMPLRIVLGDFLHNRQCICRWLNWYL